MMQDNQGRSLEDQIRSGVPNGRSTRLSDSPEEIIRRSAERAGKKIKEIFAEEAKGDAENSK